MQSTRIYRAARSSISALGQYFADFDLLQAELEKLKPGARSVIAEPVLSADGATIDWYVPGRVNARPLEQASQEEQDAAEIYLAELREIADAHADELKRSSDPDSHQLAAALKAIFTLPSRDFMFLVDGSPVLAGWAHRKDETEEHRVGFHVIAPAHPEPRGRTPETATFMMSGTAADGGPGQASTAGKKDETETRQRRPWLTSALLVLLLLLLALILWLLFRACTIGPLQPAMTWIGLETRCQTETSRIQSVQSLTRQLEDLERLIALDVSACAPVAEPDLERRLEEARVDVSQGEFEITLLWTGKSDLDLAVVFECGPGATREISYKTVDKPVCRGVLDKDFNRRGGSDPNAEAAEHVTWERIQDLPTGPMRIYVTRYTTKSDPRTEIAYDLVIHRNGEVVQRISGQASKRGRTAKDRRQLVLTLEN